MATKVKSVEIAGIDMHDLWKATGIVIVDDPQQPTGVFSVPLTEEERELLKPLLSKVSSRLKSMIGNIE